MPWESKGGGSGGGPWGTDGNGGGGTGDSGGSGGGAGGPKNPWGPTPPPKPPSGGNGSGGGNKGGSTPDFDEFIRKSQERLRNSLTGGTSGGGGARTTIPWGYVAVAVVAMWIAFTSTYRVGPQERGVVQRFGRFVETTGPGLHFKLPSPIDSVQTPAVQTVNMTNIGATEGNENLILTGDQNLVNMAYTVRWRIADPIKFLFELAEPQENTVREVAESAMRSEVSRVSLDAAIGSEREQIGQQARDRMQQILNDYHSGIEVVGVDIRNADPPAAVHDAFNQVSAARQQAQSYQNQGRAYAQQVVNKAQAAVATFDQLYAQYKLAPEVTRRRLYYETMEEVLAKNQTTVIEPRGVNPYLLVPPARGAMTDALPKSPGK